MTHTIFVTALLTSITALVLADLYERYRMAPQPRPTATGPTLAFLAAVLIVYQLIQSFLTRLLPGPESVVHSCAALLASWLPGLLSKTGEPTTLALTLSVITGLYIGGLVDYLMHRFVSHSRLLWFTHEYHHLPSEVFLLMPGLAARPFAIVAAFPVTVCTAASAYSVLAALGQPLATLTPMRWLLYLHVMLLVTSHSSFLRHFPLVHTVMKAFGLTTPHEHLLHHTTDLHGNYANLTTVWDRVFGTYIDPGVVSMEGRKLGLAYDQDWLGAVTLGRVKLPPSIRARFAIGRWCNLEP